MHKSIKGVVLAMAVVSAAFSTSANAGLSANFGFMSDYLYRGIYQTSSSAYTGLDYETGGFYVGAWLADVDDGIEVDVYPGLYLGSGQRLFRRWRRYRVFLHR